MRGPLKGFAAKWGKRTDSRAQSGLFCGISGTAVFPSQVDQEGGARSRTDRRGWEYVVLCGLLLFW